MLICHAMMVSVCSFVFLSVTFVYCMKTRSRILKIIFFTVEYQHNSLFFTPSSDREIPNWGVECSWELGIGKNSNSRPISAFMIHDWSSVVNSFDRGVYFITADADDDRHGSVNVVLWRQDSTSFFFTARRLCIGRTMPWQDVCLPVRLSVRQSVTRRYFV